MRNSVIEHIAQTIKGLNNHVVLIENNDGFLFREDVIALLSTYDISVHIGGNLSHRIQYELKKPEDFIILLSKNKVSYLEDIRLNSVRFEFNLKDFIPGYHIQTLVDEEVSVLGELILEDKPLIAKTRTETIQILENLKEKVHRFDLAGFKEKLTIQFDTHQYNWHHISTLLGEAIVQTIGSPKLSEVFAEVERINEIFQTYLKSSFNQAKNASAVKNPTIVSNILDYFDFNFKGEKVALIVVDGLSFWQYQLLKEYLPSDKDEHAILSWIPSITQLSRQAIFRGAIPTQEYKQGPVNESKLWFDYWIKKGFSKSEIRYNHEQIDLENLQNTRRFALVYKDLDDYMHSSIDYLDLLKLTQNWIERSRIINTVNALRKENFNVFITTDHGNIEATGWRGLSGREKIGTNKSGSRSSRHIEYSETWLKDEFIKNNPSLDNDIVMDESVIYFKSNKSFSTKDKLVTHGGSHILEVLLPFIKITNE